MAEGFTLDDIIEYEVEKRLNKKAESSGAENMIEEHIGKFLKNPRKYIKMFQDLQQASQSLQGGQGANQPNQSGGQPNPPTAKQENKNKDNSMDTDKIIKGVDNAITMIIQQFGDIPISQLQTTIRNNPEAVKSMINEYVEKGEK